MSAVPSIAHALIAVLLTLIGGAFIYGCIRLAESPLARHLCGVCNRLSCGYCQDEERNRKVSEYAAQARERRERQAARG